jgi:uncharacterized small protein (DUF1192 family)
MGGTLGAGAATVSAGAAAENRHLRAQLFRANQEIAELKARIGHLQREIEELRARLPQRTAPAGREGSDRVLPEG